jgi:hypothetical protein
MSNEQKMISILTLTIIPMNKFQHEHFPLQFEIHKSNELQPIEPLYIFDDLKRKNLITFEFFSSSNTILPFMNRFAKFSLTIPSEAAKNAKTCEMK